MIDASPVITSSLPVVERRPLTPSTINGMPDLRHAIINSDNDAVKVSLSKNSASSSGDTGPFEGLAGGGALTSALSSIGQIAATLKQMQNLLQSAAPGSARAASIQQEIANIQLAYQNAIGSDSFRRQMDFLSQLQSSGASGAAAASVAKNAGVGEEIMGLIRGGSVSQMSQLSNSLRELSVLDPIAPCSADLMLSSVSQALSNVAAPGSAASLAQQAAPEGELRMISAPVIERMSFEDASQISIGLRTLDSADMIKAAAAHMDLDLQHALILIGPGSRDDEDKETKPEQDEADDKDKLGLFYGNNAPSALLAGELPDGDRIKFHDGQGQVETTNPGSSISG